MLKIKTGITGLLALVLAQAVQAQPIDDEIHFIVKFKQHAAPQTLQNQLSKTIQLSPLAFQPMAGGAYTVVFNQQAVAAMKGITGDKSQWVLERLRANPEIQYAVKDRKGFFKPTPKVPQSKNLIKLSHELQWDEFKAPAGIFLESEAGKNDGAWAISKGQARMPVVVAVLDTGVEENPALVDNLVKDEQGRLLGWNFAANNNDVHDETGSYHGTHVAGTIAAYGDVMQGVGTELKILPVKIPGASGMFYESQVINGIYWSVGGEVPGVPTNTNPAKVLNMSFGIDEGPGREIDHCDEALQDALAFVRHQGAVVSAAAGNDNRWDHYNAPAVCNHVMRVASTGPKGLRAYYSNYGAAISFAAPGGDKKYGMTGAILSTVHPDGGYMGSGFDFYQGTSMAAPHAAGVAALLYAATNHNITPQRVEQTLYATTHAFGDSSSSDDSCIGEKPCGSGILDADNAIKAAIANYDVLLSAPTVHALSKACSHASTLPAQIKADGATWKSASEVCNKAIAFQAPRLSKQANQFVADYGSVRLTLDTSSYRQCQNIGHNGVGCYR